MRSPRSPAATHRARPLLACLAGVHADASPSAHFTVALAGGCDATILVAAGADATHSGVVAQANGGLVGADAVLGRGGPHGVGWVLAEFPVSDAETGEPTAARRLYGIAVSRIAPGRWMHVRVFAGFGGVCGAQDRNAPAFVAALEHLLGSVRVEARLVAAKR